MKAFDAWALPGPLVEELSRAGTAGKVATVRVDGAPVRRLDLSQDDVSFIATSLRGAGERLRALPSVSIAKALGGVGSRFADPQDVLRLEALSFLPETSGLSREMATLVLDGMCRDWTTEVFLELLEREFGRPEALDEAGSPEEVVGLTTHLDRKSVV